MLRLPIALLLAVAIIVQAVDPAATLQPSTTAKRLGSLVQVEHTELSGNVNIVPSKRCDGSHFVQISGLSSFSGSLRLKCHHPHEPTHTPGFHVALTGNGASSSFSFNVRQIEGHFIPKNTYTCRVQVVPRNGDKPYDVSKHSNEFVAALGKPAAPISVKYCSATSPPTISFARPSSFGPLLDFYQINADSKAIRAFPPDIPHTAKDTDVTLVSVHKDGRDILTYQFPTQTSYPKTIQIIPHNVDCGYGTPSPVVTASDKDCFN